MNDGVPARRGLVAGRNTKAVDRDVPIVLRPRVFKLLQGDLMRPTTVALRRREFSPALHQVPTS